MKLTKEEDDALEIARMIWEAEKAIAGKIVDDANAKFYALRDKAYAAAKARD
jgi:hypothetical protein